MCVGAPKRAIEMGGPRGHLDDGTCTEEVAASEQSIVLDKAGGSRTGVVAKHLIPSGGEEGTRFEKFGGGEDPMRGAIW